MQLLGDLSLYLQRVQGTWVGNSKPVGEFTRKNFILYARHRAEAPKEDWRCHWWGIYVTDEGNAITFADGEPSASFKLTWWCLYFVGVQGWPWSGLKFVLVYHDDKSLGDSGSLQNCLPPTQEHKKRSQLLVPGSTELFTRTAVELFVEIDLIHFFLYANLYIIILNFIYVCVHV